MANFLFYSINKSECYARNTRDKLKLKWKVIFRFESNIRIIERMFNL